MPRGIPAKRTYWPCQLCRARDGHRPPQAVGTIAGIRVCQRHLERVQRINQDARQKRPLDARPAIGKFAAFHQGPS